MARAAQTSPTGDFLAGDGLKKGALLDVSLSHLLCAMSQVLDLGENKDLGHGQRVALLTLALADALGPLNHQESAELAVAALLHDIGLPAVVYSLYQRAGEDGEGLLSSYPDYQTIGEEEGLEATLARHVEAGARILRQLGYGELTIDAVAAHHRFHDGITPRSLASLSLRLADLIDTATYRLDTAAQRKEAALQLVSALEGKLSESKQRRLRLALTSTPLWEEIIFLDTLTEKLDELFSATFGKRIPFEALEAHLRVLAEVVDSQSPYMVGHTMTLTRIAGRIAETMGLPIEERRELHLACLLHGAGRLSVPSTIIDKRGGLSDEEFRRLHDYPIATRDAFAPVKALANLVDQASTHREKLDGSGYPEGLNGERIPMIGRIIGVSDTFVALTSERPYRPAYSRSRAIAIVQAESARLFDGIVTDALEAVYREGF